MNTYTCDGSCRTGRCGCGGNDVLGDGQTLRVGLMLRDGAAPGQTFHDGNTAAPSPEALDRAIEIYRNAGILRERDAWGQSVFDAAGLKMRDDSRPETNRQSVTDDDPDGWGRVISDHNRRYGSAA